MTDNNHPITPPIELLRRLREEAPKCPDQGVITLEEWVAREVARQEWIATQAARWGADQELEACCELASQFNYDDYRYQDELRAARRPKPKSQAEKALASLDGVALPEEAWQAVSAALERLRELEKSND